MSAPPPDYRSLIKSALLKLDETQAKLAALELAKTEKIAVIGIGCRFPGGSNNPESFWRALRDGVDAVGKIPRERWDADAYFDSDRHAPGKMYIREAAFLDEVAQFDPQFFGISPREATSLDPQQRLLLEVAWEALENAGLTSSRLAQNRSGVFVGIGQNDYAQFQLNSGDLKRLNSYDGTGNGFSFASGRLSYFLGLKGPNLAVDAACASSLVAVHLACQSLRNRECGVALAGGVQLNLSPDLTVYLSRTQALAPDGRCKTFDAAADGFGRGEGCGMVVLKRLSDAVTDGDSILALICGSALNHNGAGSGIMVPSELAQEELIRQTLAEARVEPNQVTYVEAHGTGTALGDPIEVGALGAVFGQDRPKDHPLMLGSVKTNIGHLEAASGIAGLIKVILALHHGEIPPHLHFKTPNPHIPWQALPFVVPLQRTPWIGVNNRRVAGVSSFGMGGANAHVLLEQAPERLPAAVADHADRSCHLLALSAKSGPALRNLAGRYVEYLAADSAMDLGDLCFSANTGRNPFNHRVSLVARSTADLGAKLGSFSAGKEISGVAHGFVREGELEKVAFLFTGQGSQYPGMGRELYATEPVFRRALDRCSEGLRSWMDKPLLEILGWDGPDNGLLQETGFTQPALFAFEYALAELWKSWGVRPDFMLGHSLGEYVAACVAGVFSLEDGLKLVASRAQLMQDLPRNGQMLAVFADADFIKSAIRNSPHEIAIAAFNGPDSIVLSGRTQALQNVQALLKAQGSDSKFLNVSHAFHSPLMEPMLADFERVLGAIAFKLPSLNLISNLTGRIAGAEIATPAYWLQHVRQPVRFSTGMETLHQRGCRLFLEIGPKPVLLGLGRLCRPDTNSVWLPSMGFGKAESEQMLESLGALSVRGVLVDWAGLDRNRNRRRIRLPNYPFDRQGYWIESNRRRPVEPNLAGNGLSSVLTLLQQGETGKIMQQLTATAPLSKEKQEALAELLQLLVDQHHRETAEDLLPDWFYEVQWRPQVRFGSVPDFIPAPKKIGAKLQARLNETISQPELVAYGSSLTCLEKLSTHYVIEAFQRLNCQFNPGECFSTEKLLKQCEIIPAHCRLFGRLLEILEIEGVLRKVQDEWEIIAMPAEPQPAAMARQILADYPLAKPEVEMLGRCGSQLAEVLQGKCDPLQLIFPAGDLTLSQALYQETASARAMNNLVRDAVAEVLKQLPPGRGLRVLEIGAGTGGTTSSVLPILPSDRTEYTFTDLSAGFLGKARERFQDFIFVRYQRLDIEQELEPQGFELQQYDLVIAANVLHATRDLRRSLRHGEQLLAPGGMLVLLEATGPQRWVDLIFGLTEGWWLFADHDLRPKHPLLSPVQWRVLLAELGFVGAATISPELTNGELLFPQSVILAGTAPTRTQPFDEQSGHWLILADAKGLGCKLSCLLRAEGKTCHLVYPGGQFQRLSEWDFEIDPSRCEDYRRLLADITSVAQSPLRQVVYLWSSNDVPAEKLNPESLQESKECGDLLRLVQALAARAATAAPSLCIVTRGAQPAEGSRSSLPGLAQSPLWGMGKIIDLEYPEFNCVRLDLEPEPRDDEAQTLLMELSQSRLDPEVAYRSGRRLAARLTKVPSLRIPEKEAFHLRAERSYLITGGLGGLGLQVAGWMLERGARYLILISRSGVSTEAKERLVAMERKGAIIRVVKADVSQEEAMSRIFAGLAQDFPPLGGIIHSAGVLDDGALRQQSQERFAKVMAAKASGAWILHRLTRAIDLDFFVLFSSAASLVGSAGQGNHAAANAFLDALAHFRRAQGLPASSINWGAWSEIGAASSPELQERIRSKGIRCIDPEMGLRAFEQVLRKNPIQAGVIAIDWPQFNHQNPSPFFADFASASSPREESVDFARLLRNAEASDRRALLLALIRGELGRVLGLGAAMPVDPSQGFFAMGLDSLTSVEFRNRLQNALRSPLPTTVAFDYPTLDKLAEFLDRTLPAPAERASATSASDDSQTGQRAALQRLDDDEIAHLLAEAVGSTK